MAAKRSPSPQPPPIDLGAFEEPDDAGLSLDELSQAYAALLGKGADPYPERSADADDSPDALAGAAPAESHEIAASDDANCVITPRSILEAALFVGHPTGEPLTSERIAALMRGVRPAEIDELVRELNETYNAESAPYAVVSVGPGYQLSLRPEFAPLRDAFYGRIREARLSQPAIDILAIVAYHQPVTQVDIDRLRGKPSGALLSQLLRRDLLQVERTTGQRRAKPVFRTTQRFLDLFGLESLSELPRSQEIEREL